MHPEHWSYSHILPHSMVLPLSNKVRDADRVVDLFSSLGTSRSLCNGGLLSLVVLRLVVEMGHRMVHLHGDICCNKCRVSPFWGVEIVAEIRAAGAH